ncbi:MAG: DUF6036 family nucleotidyltransferase [Bdellovibrionales bacterium]
MKNINSKSIVTILNSLNNELSLLNISRELNIFGSGALILLEISKLTRETTDLDILSPTGDVELLKASEKVAATHGIDKEWLNSIGHRFSKYLPTKWDSRLITVYEGSNLKVKSLSKGDLLFTKVKALFNRGMSDDLEDILALCSSFEEVNELVTKINFSDKDRLQAITNQLKEAYANLQP